MTERASGKLLQLFNQWETGFNTPAWMTAGELINGIWLQSVAIENVTGTYPLLQHKPFKDEAEKLISELKKAQDAYAMLKTGEAGIRLNASGNDFDIVKTKTGAEGIGQIIPILVTAGVVLIAGCIGWLAQKVVERDKLKNEGLRIIDEHMRWVATQPDGVQNKIKNTPEWIEAMASFQKAGVPAFDIGPGTGLSIGMIALIIGGLFLLQYLGKK